MIRFLALPQAWYAVEPYNAKLINLEADTQYELFNDEQFKRIEKHPRFHQWAVDRQGKRDDPPALMLEIDNGFLSVIMGRIVEGDVDLPEPSYYEEQRRISGDPDWGKPED